MSEPTTQAGRALLGRIHGPNGCSREEVCEWAERILAIESEALPSIDLLARAIEATAQRPWSALGSRAHAEAILEWLRGEGT